MKNRIPELDGVRGIAVLLVFFVHIIPQYVPTGGLGVDVFFVLSGYLITSILLNELDRTGHINYKAFYIRRALRLIPALIGVLVFATVYALTRGHSWASVASTAALVLGYAANWPLAYDRFDLLGVVPHAWSLAVEEHFYLLWPVLLAWLHRKCSALTVARITIALIVAVAIWRAFLLLSGSTENRCYFGTDTRIDGPLIGSLAAMVARTSFQISKPVAAGAAAILAFGLFRGTAHGASYFLGFGLTFSLSVAAAMLWLLQHSSTLAHRVLRFRVLTFTGQISYSLYLWHFALILALGQHVKWSRSVTLGTLALCYAVAVLSYYLVERPFLRLKDRTATASLTCPRLQSSPLQSAPGAAVPYRAAKN